MFLGYFCVYQPSEQDSTFLSSLEIHFYILHRSAHKNTNYVQILNDGQSPHSGISLNVICLVPSTKPYKTGKLIYYSAIETTCKFLLPSCHLSLSSLTINNFQFQELRSFHCATSFQKLFRQATIPSPASAHGYNHIILGQEVRCPSQETSQAFATLLAPRTI